MDVPNTQTDQPTGSGFPNIEASQLCRDCDSIFVSQWHRLSKKLWGRNFSSRQNFVISEKIPAAPDSVRADPPSFADVKNYFGSGGFIYGRDANPASGDGMFTNPKFHLNLHQISASYQRGCHFCATLWAAVKAELEEKGQALEFLPQNILESVSLLPLVYSSEDNERSQAQSNEPGYCIWFFLFYEEDVSKPLYPHIIIDIRLTEGGNGYRPIADFSAEGPLRDDTIARIKTWISACADSHTDCSTGTTSAVKRYTPPRLLAVQPLAGNNPTYKLVETAKELPGLKYATLSHCWGDQTIRTLKQHNYLDFTKGTALYDQHLPRTFREAARVCRALDIQYLWIDALCIVQDDEDDWRHHAAEMASVYAHGWINLAAAYAKDSHGGLLGQCTDPLTVNNVCTKVWWTGDCKLDNTYVLQNRHFWFKTHDHAALYQRGWVLQEDVLSPRTIQFTTEQVKWHCRQAAACETWSVADTIPSNPRKFLAKGDWMNMIDEYRKLKLSHSKDILAALAGVASAFGRQHGYEESQYIAGLWLPELPQQLLWWSVNGHHRTDGLVPSWTWASQLGETLRHGLHYTLPITQAKRERIRVHPSFQIVQSCSNSNAANPFTVASGAYLQIRGLLHTILLRDTKCFRRRGEDDIHYHSQAMLGSRQLSLVLDPREAHSDDVGNERGQPGHVEWNRAAVSVDWVQKEHDQDVSAFFLPLLQDLAQERFRSPTGSVYGLLLARTFDKGNYKRIGKMHILPYVKINPEDAADALQSLPEWHTSHELASDEYLKDHGNGVYELRLV